MIERVVPGLAVTDHPAGSAWPLCCNATQSGVALVIGMGVDITRHTVNDRARNGATAAQRRGDRSRRPGAVPALPDRQAWRQRRHYRRASEMIRLAGERQGHQPATEAGCPGDGVTTGSEPAPADAAPGLGRRCARVTGGGYRQVPLPDRHAGSHPQGLRSPDGDVGGVEGDLLICCEPAAAGRPRRRGKQGECRDGHLGCLAGAEPAGEGQPR